MKPAGPGLLFSEVFEDGLNFIAGKQSGQMFYFFMRWFL